MMPTSRHGRLLRISTCCLLAAAPLHPALSHAAALGRVAPVRVGPVVGSQASAGALAPASIGVPLLRQGPDALGLGPSLPTLSPSPSPLLSPTPSPTKTFDVPLRVTTSRSAAVPGVPDAAAPAPRASRTPALDPAALPAVRVRTRSASSTAAAGPEEEREASKPQLGFLSRLSLSKTPAALWENSGRRLPSAVGRSASAVNEEDGRRHIRGRPGTIGLLRTVLGQDELPPEEPGSPFGRDRIRIPERTWKLSLEDRLYYYQILVNAYFWRFTTRLAQQWERLRKRRAASGGEPAVEKPIRFFVEAYTLGSSGRFSVFGPSASHTGIVAIDAWAVFNKYFTPHAGARDAFTRLMARATKFNPNKQATQFRKIISYNLIAASALPIEQVPEFFESLIRKEEGREIERYQEQKQQQVLAEFEATVDRTILDINKHAQPGQRIVGLLVMGSYATGAAGPDSDFDAQAVAEDGSTLYLPTFFRMLKERWERDGHSNPIGDYQYALPISKGLLRMIHKAPYLILSPYPEVRGSLSLAPGEARYRAPPPRPTLMGKLFLFLYRSAMKTALVVYEAYQTIRLRRRK